MVLTVCLCLLCLFEVNSQLVINIKNKGGEVFQEHIFANTVDDTIQVEYRNTDDSVITQLIDFKHEIQILRIISLGEEERDQNQYESLCFVTLLNRTDFITSDAMSKLRQRNPGTIRQADEDKGTDIFEMDYVIDPKQSSVLSPHIAKFCDSSNALNASQTFVKEIDIRYLAEARDLKLESVTASLSKLSSSVATPKPVRCKELSQSSTKSGFVGRTANDSWTRTSNEWRCQCHVYICIAWYPCGLKYCKGKDSNGVTISYKCGIRTCKKCNLFRFNVRQKQNCLWDD